MKIYLYISSINEIKSFGSLNLCKLSKKYTIGVERAKKYVILTALNARNIKFMLNDKEVSVIPIIYFSISVNFKLLPCTINTGSTPVTKKAEGTSINFIYVEKSTFGFKCIVKAIDIINKNMLTYKLFSKRHIKSIKSVNITFDNGSIL